MINKIKSKILEAVPEATVYVADPQRDGQHFEAIVISPSFEGLSLVKQHQTVMLALSEDFKEEVHALQLKTFTAANWESQKQNYKIEE